MKDNADANAGLPRIRDLPPAETPTAEHVYSAGNPRPPSPRNGAPAARVDFWAMLDLVLARWHWLVLGSAVFASLFFLLAYDLFKPKFTASAVLQRYETPGVDGFFKNGLSAETFASMLRSPELLRRVGEQSIPPLRPEVLAKSIKVDPDPDSDMVTLILMSRNREQAVELLNVYATNAVTFMREWYSRGAESAARDYLKKQVEQMDSTITALEQQFRNMPRYLDVSNKLAQVGGQLGGLGTNLAAASATSAMVARQTERLNTAMGELNDLLVKYTEINPIVIAKSNQIAALQKQIAEATTNKNYRPELAAMAPRPGETPFNPELDIIRTKLLSLEEGRVQLSNRQREAELFAAAPPGIVRVFAAADPNGVRTNHRGIKIGAATIFGGLVGLAASLLLVLLVEFGDNRIKTVDDLARVTRLPILTTLGNLHEMDAVERSRWAFRTWTMLQGRLSRSANHGLVCGFTSSSHDEGRSTWVSLLAEAASLTGFRVLTIATRPSPTHVVGGSNGNGSQLPESQSSSTALTTSVLTSPGQIASQLTGDNPQPVVHVPLPGWVWNLERRNEWRQALEHWRQIDNLVILIELPPAGVAEAVLLGSHLPNLVWLADSGTATAADTRVQLETLRHARCHLAGAVLNREPATPLRRRFPRWLNCLVLAGALAASAHAQESAPAAQAPRPSTENSAESSPDPAAAANRSFSIVNPAQRAAWQQRLTLGPGDVLNLGLYGAPELARTEVAIGPDGRISYLEAQDVLATGLTVDELRAKLDQELAKYRRAPHTLITPVTFKSKKYFMLGKIMSKGVYILDRPLTVIEAIARAHGLENALVDRNVLDLADFQRSFIARGGKRIPLDFEKLFQVGDLSQNLAVEPDDYVYIAPADVKEVYVVGEVRLPGPATYTPNLTIIGAITTRGGFTDRAHRAHVLVIRGSLDHPEKIAVNTHAIVDAKEPDFKLRPGDIIYVNSRPFIQAEEIGDAAITAFIQAVITTWVGVDVVKPIQ